MKSPERGIPERDAVEAIGPSGSPDTEETRVMDEPHPTLSLPHRLSVGLGAPFTPTPSRDVAALAQRLFAVTPTAVTRFATERDDTFRLIVGGDPHGFVLKISPPGDSPAEITLQGAAVTHASARDAALPLQRFVPPVTADPLHNGRAVRLVRYLPGQLLGDVTASPTELRSVGRMLGRLTNALADFEHPAATRWLAWDLVQLGELGELLPCLEGEDRQRVVASVLEVLTTETLPALHATPRQVVHNDFHGGNLVVDKGAPEFVTGILDFGDVVSSHRAADLAIAMSYAGSTAQSHSRTFPRPGHDPWAPALTLAAGYREATWLGDEEVALLPALVLGRLIQRLLLGSWLATNRPENAEYTGRNLDITWRQFVALRGSLSPRERVGH